MAGVAVPVAVPRDRLLADHAAATGLASLRLAAGPGYGQALGELRRTAAQLRPHARRPAVRELRQALTALPI
ncbi:hypothetical protein AB0B78_31105 [Streptomyces sp. NPDC040724]|uniref:hypothetical protein n=1 Tax=Streptomyces sp. NPDC040724 TaxID=3155612 RepID=UPI0033DF80C5